MARKPEYKQIEITKPSKIIFDSQEVNVKPFIIRAPIRSQNNGGARITISKDYADYEALIFIINKKGVCK